MSEEARVVTCIIVGALLTMASIGLGFEAYEVGFAWPRAAFLGLAAWVATLHVLFHAGGLVGLREE